MGGRAAVPLPVIVAGDFNTLSYKHWDPRIAPPDAFEQLTSPRPSAKKRAGADRGACRLPLRSAYADVQGAEPCYTSVDPAFPHCIDYVFCNSCPWRRGRRTTSVSSRRSTSRAWARRRASSVTGAASSPEGAAATTTLKYRSSPSAATTGTTRAARASAGPDQVLLFGAAATPGRRATLYTPQKRRHAISVHQDHK